MTTGMKLSVLSVLSFLLTIPAHAAGCDNPPGMTSIAVSRTHTAVVNGNNYKCSVKRSDGGYGYDVTEWKCEGIQIDIMEPNMLSAINSIASGSSRGIHYTLTDKKGQKFYLSKMRGWSEKPDHYCGIESDGKTARGYVVESISNGDISITLTTNYVNSFIPKAKPSL
jgi:hypothetical protein